MRYAIFSDVHGNLEAFEAVLSSLEQERIDKFIYLGDIVGYGADPNECISCLKKINPVCIAGNHDWAAIGKLDLNYFNPRAKEAILWTERNLRGEFIAYLEQFEIIHEEEDFVFVHGSLHNPEKFYYVLDTEDARDNFSLLKKEICFIGHSHRTEAYILEGEKVVRLRGQYLKINKGSKYIINVGSVGQPRDGDPRASFCIYDSKERVAVMKRLAYNIEKAAEKIINKGLPAIFAERLYSGF